MTQETNFNFKTPPISHSALPETSPNKENIDPKTDKKTDEIAKKSLGHEGGTKTKRKAAKPLGGPPDDESTRSHAKLLKKGVESVASKSKPHTTSTSKVDEGLAKGIPMPTKHQMERATYHPFRPGDEVQDDTEVSLSALDDFSATREMGTGTTNTVGMYRTTIDGQEYFVKRVSRFIAEGAETIDQVADKIGFKSEILPSTYVNNPADPTTAFLFTPMLKHVHDVPTEVLTTTLGDKAKEFLVHMAIFDHIISNIDRSNFKQLMESDGHIYLADNDNSLEQTSIDFGSRTSGHVIELFADEMELDYKKLEIPKELIDKSVSLGEDLESLVANISDPDQKESIKYSIQKGLEGISALKDLETPTLGDLCEMSPTMDKLMGYLG